MQRKTLGLARMTVTIGVPLLIRVVWGSASLVEVAKRVACWCLYDCPPLKTCEDGFPVVGGCDDQQCDAVCATKHPIPGRGAEGFCYSMGDPMYASCRCKYFC